MWKGHERPQPQRRRAALRQGAEKPTRPDHSPMHMPRVRHRQDLKPTLGPVSRHTPHMLLSAQACVFRALVLEAEGHASLWQESVLSPHWEQALAKWSSFRRQEQWDQAEKNVLGSPRGQGCSPIAYGGSLCSLSSSRWKDGLSRTHDPLTQEGQGHF